MKADWANGVWTSKRDDVLTNSAKRLTIGSDWLPLRGYGDIIAADPLAIYGDLLPLLRVSDLNLINVETTLGTAGKPIPKAGPNFQADEHTVRSLTEVPFHIACMANNHIMDYGPDSLQSTLDVLQKAGMKTIGAGMTGEEAARPLIVDLDGIRVGMINCSEGEACVSYDNRPGAYGFEPVQIAQQVQSLKQACDFVLVVFHGGREYVPMPPQYVVDGLRLIAEAGASAVIGHHPHVPQGLEWHGDVPIVYSQGNFVFWQDHQAFYRHAGYLVHLDITKKGIARLELTPYVIGPEGLSLMQDGLKAGFLKMLRLASELLVDSKRIQAAWDAYVDTVGLGGMKRNLRVMLEMLDEDVAVGAARMQNLFFCPAHRHLFIDGLRRATHDELGNSPQWAKTLVDHWLNCTYEDGKKLLSNQTVLNELIERIQADLAIVK